MQGCHYVTPRATAFVGSALGVPCSPHPKTGSVVIATISSTLLGQGEFLTCLQFPALVPTASCPPEGLPGMGCPELQSLLPPLVSSGGSHLWPSLPSFPLTSSISPVLTTASGLDHVESVTSLLSSHEHALTHEQAPPP